MPLNINPLYFFKLKHYILQKEPIKVQIFETFECSGENMSNSSCQFGNDKSILLPVLHHSSLSWYTTPMKILSSYIFYFRWKNLIKVPILRLSRSLVKVFQIYQVSFEYTSHFSIKFCINIQYQHYNHFWTDKSVALQFLHHSSLSWHITPL